MTTLPRPIPPVPNDAATKEERRRRYAALSQKMDEWSNEPTEIDDDIEPLVEAFLHENSPRLFPRD